MLGKCSDDLWHTYLQQARAPASRSTEILTTSLTVARLIDMPTRNVESSLKSPESNTLT